AAVGQPPGATQHGHASLRQPLGNVLGLLRRQGLDPRVDSGQVHARDAVRRVLADPDAEFGCVLKSSHDVGGRDEGLGRDAVSQYRGSADAVAVDDGHLRAEPRGHQRRLVAAGSATDDRNPCHRLSLIAPGTSAVAVSTACVGAVVTCAENAARSEIRWRAVGGLRYLRSSVLRGRHQCLKRAWSHEGASGERIAMSTSMSSRLGVLRYRDFRFLLIDRFVAPSAFAFSAVCVSFAVLNSTVSTADLSYVLAAQIAPNLVFGPLGGVIADRIPPQYVIALANLLVALFEGTLGLLVLTHSAQLWQMIALEAGTGTAIAIFYPASQALLPKLVPDAE